METKKNCFAKCYTTWETFLEKMFGKLGSMVSRRPKLIMAICIFFNLAIAFGLFNIKVDNDVESLYTPMKSKSTKDRTTIRELFGTATNDYFQTYQLIGFGRYGAIAIISRNKSNIMEQAFVDEINKIDTFIRDSINVKDASGKDYHYDDICARSSSKCVVSGGIILNKTFQQLFVDKNVSYPYYNGELLSPLFAEAKSKNGKLMSTNGAKLTYYLDQSNSSALALSKLWEEAFVSKLLSFQTNLTDIAFSHSDSLGSELNKNTNNDIKFFAITFTLMMTYASLSSLATNCNNVANRGNLGIAGILAPTLAIASSFGFVSAIGVEFTNIVGVMPFLVVGIGIDDMFILMSGIADAPSLSSKSSIEDRMVFMMQKSGIAITITSITDLLAFAIGASSVFKSIRNFCIYTGVAIFFCYLNQLFFFSPAVRINEERTKEKRHYCFCWKKVEPENYYIGETKCFIRCIAGHPPESRNDVESPMEKYPKKFILFILRNIWGKAIVTILFITYLGSSIYGCVNLEQGLQLFNLAAKDSYFYKYSSWDDIYFTRDPVVMVCLTSEQNYALNNTQYAIRNLLTEVKNDQTIDNSFEINWLSAYKNSPLYDDTSEGNFIAGLKQFLSIKSEFTNDIVFDDTNAKIKYSRFYLKSTNIKTSTEQGNFMLNMRKFAERSPVPCLIYTPAFIFFEQYVQILPSTMQTIGIAVAVMLIITFVFMPDFRVVFIICVTLISILTGIFGFMHYWDLTLSSITMIHLVMSVGFSVDFSVHVCHAFISVVGDGRQEVLINALDRSGGPIVNAAFSSLLGIFMLVFSTSYIFTSFGKLMFLVIGFGLLHAAFFLPLLLYWISPCLRKDEHAKVSSSAANMNVDTHSVGLSKVSIENIQRRVPGTFTDLHTPKN